MLKPDRGFLMAGDVIIGAGTHYNLPDGHTTTAMHEIEYIYLSYQLHPPPPPVEINMYNYVPSWVACMYW